MLRYKKLRQRYTNQVEELVAVSQLWQCYGRLRQAGDGKAMEDAMRDLLKSLPDTAFDGSSPIHKREFWQKWWDKVTMPLPAGP